MKTYFLGMLIMPVLALIHVFEVKDNGILPSNNAANAENCVKYNLVAVSDTLSWLRSIRSEDSLKVICAINRVNQKHMFRQDTIVLPDIFVTDLLAYSPFPQQMDTLAQVDKIIFFSYAIQAFAAYEHGCLVRWGPVSMGKQSTPTPTGLLHTNWRSKRTVSTVDPTWIMNWYFNLHNFQGVSMHEYDLPGYPASHACVRLLAEDAIWLYYWADPWILQNSTTIAAYGTPVVIYGSYPFGERKPWYSLAEDSNSLSITPTELTAEIAGYLPLILERQQQREYLYM